MCNNLRSKLRKCISEKLQFRGKSGEFTDTDSLFISGRLDSLAAMEFLLFLESEFKVDFAKVGFELSKIDSVDAVIELLGEEITEVAERRRLRQ